MSGGRNSSNKDDDGNDEGWESNFFKVASAAAAAATLAGGLYALLKPSEPQVTVEARASRGTREEASDSQSRVAGKKPEDGWVKLNVDGSRVHQGPSRFSGCGGVLRDGSGTWLHGFSQKLDPNFEVHETEMMAILTGLGVAREMNLKKILVESDSETVVSMVQNGCRKGHPQIEMIREIRRLCYEDPKWEVRLVSIPRSANRVANRLANDARLLPDYVVRKYSSAPNNITALLSEEAQGGVRFESFGWLTG